MKIDEGMAQANLKFTGALLPTGAEITLGMDIIDFAGGPIDAGGNISDNWATCGILACLGTSLNMSSVLVKFGPNDDGPAAEYVQARFGTRSGNQCSPQVAGLVRKVTLGGGRKNRGRFFLPGMLENDLQDDGLFSGTYITLVNTALADFLTKMQADNLRPVVLHSEATGSAAIHDITTFQLDARCATQRRRNRR